MPGYQANVLFRGFGLVGAGDAEKDFLLEIFNPLCFVPTTRRHHE